MQANYLTMNSCRLGEKGIDLSAMPYRFSRNLCLHAAALGLVGASVAARDSFGEPSPATAETPNVVVLHVDDLGWRDLGCMGSPVYETPNIDKLAASGILFSSAYASASICSPSRACMLTGSQPSRHGVYTVNKNRGSVDQWKVTPVKNRQYLENDYPTIGNVLSDAAIVNGAIGKWHFSAKMPSHGFMEGALGGYLGLPINYFAPFELPFLPRDVPAGTYLPALVRQAGVDFLERHRQERFFLYFATYLPHDEIRNEGEESNYDGIFRLAAPEAVVQKYRDKMASMTAAGEDLQGHDDPIYAAMIEETDRSVGAIMDKIDALDLREKTLVLFISDNGGLSKYTSQRPLRGEKVTLYEGGIRVPMIASMPGRIRGGQISDEPVSGLDFYPTICTVMRVNPSDPDKVDGKDLTGYLFGGQSLGERNLFWNFPIYTNPEDISKSPSSVMRRGDWKIHHFYEDDSYELYNLKEDIGESENLAETHHEELARMRKELESCYARFGAVGTLPLNPAYNAEKSKAERAVFIKNQVPNPAKISTIDFYRRVGFVQ